MFRDFPLHDAVWQTDCASVQAQLNADANVNAATPEGVTPLMVACWRNNLTLVKRLLQCGANPSLTNKLKETALHMAADKPRISKQIIRALLRSGASPSARCIQGHTPYLRAVRNPGNGDLWPMLYQPHDQTAEGLNPLMLACVHRSRSSVERLLLYHREEYPPNAVTPRGNTALHFVCRQHPFQHTIARRLLLRGADPHIRNRHGFSPADYAGDNLKLILTP